MSLRSRLALTFPVLVRPLDSLQQRENYFLLTGAYVLRAHELRGRYLAAASLQFLESTFDVLQPLRL